VTREIITLKHIHVFLKKRSNLQYSKKMLKLKKKEIEVIMEKLKSYTKKKFEDNHLKNTSCKNM
jgi:REP element-mobilizing transposase RayT